MLMHDDRTLHFTLPEKPFGRELEIAYALSAELTARIATLLGHTPESWIRIQEALDVWHIAQDPSRLAGITPLPREVFAA
jgi:plasmid maintenance system antidote protein VapI